MSHAVNGSENPHRLYTPAQIATASLLGGPLPACWFVAQNAKRLLRPSQRSTWLAVGIGATLLLLILVLFVLPDSFPPYILPIAYTVALREVARRVQGEAISSHRAAGGAVGSWWAVVGLGVSGLALLLGLIFLVILLFPSSFPA